MNALTPDDFNKILSLKDQFPRERASFANPDMNNAVINLVSALDSVKFTPVFDYNEWLNSMNADINYLTNPETLKNFDMDTLRKIMTAHIRIDRFSRGHLESLISSGYIRQFLDRVEDLTK